jgi:hypothetical protein
MTATTPSAVLVPVQPVFTDAERLALAGFLAGYRGLTRDAYALDLRQFTTWCRARSLPLFAGFYRCAVDKNCSSIPRPRTSAAPAWMTNRTRSAWTATNSAGSWSPQGSDQQRSTR